MSRRPLTHLLRYAVLMVAVLSAATVALVNYGAASILTIGDLHSLIYDSEERNSWTWKQVSPQFKIVRFKSETDLATAGLERDLQKIILELSNLSGLEFVMVGPDKIDNADGAFFYEDYDPGRREQWFKRAVDLNREFESAGLSEFAMKFFRLAEMTREVAGLNNPPNTACEVRKLAMMGTVNKSMGVYDLRASDAGHQEFVTCLTRSLLFSIGLRGIDNLKPEEIVISSANGYALSPAVRCAVAVLYSDDVESNTWLPTMTPIMEESLANLEVCR